MLAVDRLSPAPDADVPATIQTGNGEFSLHQGRSLVFFFNPFCPHCFEVGETMSKLTWSARIVGVPTQDYQFGPGFVEDTHLRDVILSPDLDLLKERFPFEDVPFAVAIENGRVRERFRFFEEPAFSAKLRELGFVQ
jgi:hypothetical protein